MGRTCGEADEIELTLTGVELNGPGRVRFACQALLALRRVEADSAQATVPDRSRKRAVIYFGLGYFS